MNIDKQFTFKVDFIRKNSLCMAEVNQEDKAIFNIFLTKNGQALDITGKQIKLFAKKPDHNLIYQDNLEVMDAKGGAIRINANTSMFQSIGTVICQIDIWGSDKTQVSSGIFLIQVGEHIGGNDAINSYVDVPLFRELAEYIDTAVELINKYKILVEAFTTAGVSIEGLHDIKKYIDDNRKDLNIQGDRASELISQMRLIIPEAEEKKRQLENNIIIASNKFQELNRAISESELKDSELKATTLSAENKKQEVNNTINLGTVKVSEIHSITGIAESKRQEITNVINLGTTKVSELNSIIVTADNKKDEVVIVTNNAETKKEQLQEILNNVDEAKYIKKSEMDSELDKKLDKSGGVIRGGLDVKDLDKSTIVGGTRLSATNECSDANTIWRSGFYDLSDGENVPFNEWTWLLHIAHRHNNPNVRYGLQIASRNVSNSLAFRTTNLEGNGKWQNIYHTGNKPTASEIGAATLNHKHIASEVGAIPNGGAGVYYIERLEASKGYQFNTDIVGYGAGIFKGNGDGASFSTNNMKLSSWYGIGFGPSIEGQIVPKGEYSHYFNVRNGIFMAKGDIESKEHIYGQHLISKGNWIKAEGNEKHISMGTGHEDCYICNSKVDKFLQLQDNGSLAFNGSFISSSDKNLKENIQYINEEKVITIDEQKEFLEFIKNFKPAQFKYKGSDSNSFGFIAQDIAESKIGKLFISKQKLRISEGIKDTKLKQVNEEIYKENLMYDLGAYTTVVATALQEVIKEKDEEISELREEITKIKKAIQI